jgi:polysaccharide biosynthesis protein PslG
MRRVSSKQNIPTKSGDASVLVTSLQKRLGKSMGILKLVFPKRRFLGKQYDLVELIVAALSIFAIAGCAGDVFATHPRFTANPSNISIKNVVVGNSSTQAVTVTNTSDTPLLINRATVAGIGFRPVGLLLPLKLVPGETFSFGIQFSPKSVSTVTGHLLLDSTGPRSPFRIALLGSGISPAPHFSISPTNLAFGILNLGDSSRRTLTLVNIGSSMLTISQATLSGTGFSLSPLVSSISLRPNQSITFDVKFTPIATGNTTGTLLLRSDAGSPVVVALSGDGAQPQSNPPIISGVSALNTAAGSAMVTWLTDKASTSEVEYGGSTSYGNSTAVDRSLLTGHSMTLDKLSPNTLFHFRVKSQDALGDSTFSGDYQFITSNTIPATLFGMTHSDVATWPTVSVGSLGKGALVNWSYSEPQRGVFNWTNLDAWVQAASAHGIDFFFSNDRIPPWAAVDHGTCSPTYSGSSVVGCTSMVANIQDWDDFLDALVTRYKGKIQIYELWNEPDQITNFSGTVSDMVTLAQHMIAKVRSIDPAALVVGPGPSQVSSSNMWLDSYFAAGGPTSIDAVTLHGYPHIANDVPESIQEFTDQAKAIMSKYRIAGKPVWDTEGSWGDTTDPRIISSLDQQAAFVARSYLLHWSNGVSRFYWYDWDGESWGAMWTPAGGPNLAATAYQQVQNWMVGAIMPAACSGTPDSTWTCGLTRSDGYSALAIWNTSRSEMYAPDLKFTQYRDLYGNTTAIPGGSSIRIGNKPVLLETMTPRN